jgi:hypothetical protein
LPAEGSPASLQIVSLRDVDEAVLEAFITEGGRAQTAPRLARATRLPLRVVRGWLATARERGLVKMRARSFWVLTEAGRDAMEKRRAEHAGFSVSLGPWKTDPIFGEWSGPKHRN